MMKLLKGFDVPRVLQQSLNQYALLDRGYNLSVCVNQPNIIITLFSILTSRTHLALFYNT